MSDGALRALADRAGIRSDWMDYRGNARIVKPDTLHALLDAMELPSATPAQIRDSDAQLNERERQRSEEHTSELQSLMRISYAVFCLKKKKTTHRNKQQKHINTQITTQ